MNVVFQYYIENLKAAMMDANEPNEVLKAHAEHGAVRDFGEFVQMLADNGDKP